MACGVLESQVVTGAHNYPLVGRFWVKFTKMREARIFSGRLQVPPATLAAPLMTQIFCLWPLWNTLTMPLPLVGRIRPCIFLLIWSLPSASVKKKCCVLAWFWFKCWSFNVTLLWKILFLPSYLCWMIASFKLIIVYSSWIFFNSKWKLFNFWLFKIGHTKYQARGRWW